MKKKPTKLNDVVKAATEAGAKVSIALKAREADNNYGRCLAPGEDARIAREDYKAVVHGLNTQVRLLIEENGRQRAEIATVNEWRERQRVQIAGCSAAAQGETQRAQQGDFGWSPAYQDVCNLRRQHDQLVIENVALYALMKKKGIRSPLGPRKS